MKQLNLAYYKKTDWKRFLESIDDKDNTFDDWKEWHKAYQKLKKRLISNGHIVKDFVVDIDELIHYCKIKGIKNNAKARSTFVANK